MFPLLIGTGVTVINEQTSLKDALQWSLELEELYIAYFGESNVTWTWDDVHELDRDAMDELEEVLRASTNPPLDTALVTRFRDPTWRATHGGWNPGVAPDLRT